MTRPPAMVEEGQFRDIVEAANEGVWLIDGTGSIVYANECLARMLGTSVPLMLGRRFVEFFHPEERDSAWSAWSELQPRERKRVERRFRRSDGATVLAVVSISAITGPNGRSGGSMALVTDITEQRQAQDALRQSEQQYRQIVETANEGILSFDRDENVVYANDSMARMLGYKAADMIGRPLRAFIAQADLPEISACIERSVRGQTQRYERQLRRTDGSIVWSTISSTPTCDLEGNLVSVLCMVTDISEQKRAEAALREQERRFREIVETANEGIWVVDAQARVVYANECMLRMLDLPAGEVLGRFTFDFVVDAERGDAEASWHSIRAGGIRRTQRRLRRRDGSTVWVLASVTPTYNAAGQFTGALSMVTDITELQQAQQALQASETALQEALAMHRRILECSLDVICTFNDKGEFVEVSENCEAMWGYKREELIGKPVMQMVHPDDVPKTLRLAQDVKAGRATRDFENRYIRKDGTVVPLLWSAMWSEEDGKTFAVAHDLTDWLQAEEKLKHFEKMQAIGQLTGGVAHDFNNLLTVILGNATIFLDELEEGHRLRPLAESSKRAAERGADLTARLLAFSRRQPLQPKAVDVNALIEGMVGLLHRSVGASIEIELLLAKDLWPAWVDAPQLETALLNLAINSRDAMPSGGRLTIETANLQVAVQTGPGDLVPGDYVAISLIDTGTGMQPEIAARAIEPFFTTKPPGKGSGLGLSMVYGFVKQSGGHARIETEVGHGCAVHMFLQRAPTAAPVQTEESVTAEPTGSETILVVEDDDLVRAYVESQLHALGYAVISVPDAHAALSIIERGVPIDLLFTDIVMPGGMNGRQLADAVRQRRPDLKVLFTSGYAQDVIARSGKLDDGLQLLSKPYRRQDLARKVRAVLSRAPVGGELDAQPSG